MANQNALKKAQLNEKIIQKMSRSEIAIALDVSVSTISRWATELNLVLPQYKQTKETILKRANTLKFLRENNEEIASNMLNGIKNASQKRKGKTVEEFFGVERGKSIRENCRLRTLGKKASVETRKKMSSSQSGRKMTTEAKMKLSSTRKQLFREGKLKLSPRAGCGKGGFNKDIGHYIRSSYEEMWAKYFIENEIPYEYEPKTFSLTDENGEIITYTPDFYRKDNEQFIEIKNEYNVHDEKFEKIQKLFEKEYPGKLYVYVGNSPHEMLPFYLDWILSEDSVIFSDEKSTMIGTIKLCTDGCFIILLPNNEKIPLPYGGIIGYGRMIFGADWKTRKWRSTFSSRDIKRPIVSIEQIICVKG